MLTHPLPLHIDSNLLAQLQQGGNLNITFNAGGTLAATQAVPLSTDPQFIQVWMRLLCTQVLLVSTNFSKEKVYIGKVKSIQDKRYDWSSSTASR